MREIILNKLSQESTWKSIVTGAAIVSTGGVAIVDPKIAGFVGMGFMAIISPIGKFIAKIINSATANYAETETKLDDIGHAFSSVVIDTTPTIKK